MAGTCCLIGKCYRDFAALIVAHRCDVTQVCLIHFTLFGRSIHQLLRHDDAPLAYPALKRSQLTPTVAAGAASHQPIKQLGGLRVRMPLKPVQYLAPHSMGEAARERLPILSGRSSMTSYTDTPSNASGRVCSPRCFLFLGACVGRTSPCRHISGRLLKKLSELSLCGTFAKQNDERTIACRYLTPGVGQKQKALQEVLLARSAAA